MDEREEISIASPSISGIDLKFMDEQQYVDGLEANPQRAWKRLKVLDKDYSLVSEEFCITSIRTKELLDKDLVKRDGKLQIRVETEAIGKRKELISPSPGKNNEEHKSAEQISDHEIEAGFSSDNCDLSCSSINRNGLSRKNIMESVNSAGQLSESDSMRVWREMKRNGFLSCPLGGVSAVSTYADSSCHGGKSEQKRLKRKQHGTVKPEKASVKQEQVDKLSEITAPCGLLNGLNPGIMNNVRNKNQVLSVLKALVKSGFEDAGIGKEQLDVND